VDAAVTWPISSICSDRIATMKPSERLAAGLLILSAFGTAPCPAGAETRLTDFDGQWLGSGQDRDLPFEPMQQTSCQTTNSADLRRLSSVTVCKGDAGLDKLIQLTITLSGETFSGTLTQKSTLRGDDTFVSVLNGSVSGHKTDNTATFQVNFPGLVPNAIVMLRLISPSSYSMKATTLGSALMDVTFTRAIAR
jgi:hypothetical protein